MTSWGNNTLKNYFYSYEDLNTAIKNISESFKLNYKKSNVLHVKYEDLITDTNQTIKQLQIFFRLRKKYLLKSNRKKLVALLGIILELKNMTQYLIYHCLAIRNL